MSILWGTHQFVNLDGNPPLDVHQPVSALRARFWYGSTFEVEIHRVSVYSANSNPPEDPPTEEPVTEEPPLENWTYCADEDQTCSFTGTRQVRYGANEVYSYLTATGSIGCNNATFGDPIPGTFKQCWYGDEEPSTEEPPTEEPVTEEPPTEEPVTEEPPTPTEVSLLPQPWNLVGDNNAAELYQALAGNELIGMDTIRVEYNLHGTCFDTGDASAIIIDQNGWNIISLSDYGTNCNDGIQTVEIPLSDFQNISGGANLDPNQTVGTLHTRFWYGTPFVVDILTITAFDDPNR